MLENLKTKVRENPEQAKKIGLAIGAVLGASAVVTILYLNRETVLPALVEEISVVDLPATE